uniref:ATP synthase complex subunit 8 n=1 Tax=Coleoptera sp. ACP-2013 TaxID=2485033 RepID=A0A3G3ME83_9COLE|nr:ATP synthase F0 subunit 8 [Coleoptera sp. ACP-2013]
MPQMAPLNWLSLFFYFLLAFLIFNTLNYFTFIKSCQTLSSTSQKKKINWKW